MRILDLELETGDAAALSAFYTETLGLPLLDATRNSFTVASGASRLTFRSKAASKAIYHFAFNITPGALAAAKEWLGSRATPLERDGEDEFDSNRFASRMVYFLDPAGNILEFIVPSPAEKNDRPFSSADIVGMCEIGLPVDDVHAAVVRLDRNFGLLPFNGMSNTFAPLGDFDGRFIVVPQGHRWFPTDRPAGAYPLSAFIEVGVNARCELPNLPYRLEAKAG